MSLYKIKKRKEQKIILYESKLMKEKEVQKCPPSSTRIGFFSIFITFKKSADSIISDQKMRQVFKPILILSYLKLA